VPVAAGFSGDYGGTHKKTEERLLKQLFCFAYPFIICFKNFAKL
jgi:hypothetical protein